MIRATLPAALGLALLLAGARPAAAVPDPLEGLNRQVHGFNRGLQAWVLGPAVEFYQAQVPPAVRQGVANIATTLGEPLVAASGLAAGRLDVAGSAAARFGINATLGWGGVRDRAGEMGYPRQAFSPGDALCAWGIPAGPYLVLPLLGPTTLRDAGGAALLPMLGDVGIGLAIGEAVMGYERAHGALAELEALSLDPYAALRSAHAQRRAARCPGDAVAEE